MTRTRRTRLKFARNFTLAGVDFPLPAGVYDIVSDEELIEGLSFPVFRRTATWIMARSSPSGPTEMVAVDPAALAAAHQHARA
jgi:hypothetical protein